MYQSRALGWLFSVPLKCCASLSFLTYCLVHISANIQYENFFFSTGFFGPWIANMPFSPRCHWLGDFVLAISCTEKHLLAFFSEKFVVACYCKDVKGAKRSHYHCPLCNFAILTRSSIFSKHLKDRHGKSSAMASANIHRSSQHITTKKGENSCSLLVKMHDIIKACSFL